MRKKYIATLAIIALPIIFWHTPNIVAKINYSRELEDIELFDNGTACARRYGEQVYFRAFPFEQETHSFLAKGLCKTLKDRNTFDDFKTNLDNRIEMWKSIINY